MFDSKKLVFLFFFFLAACTRQDKTDQIISVQPTSEDSIPQWYSNIELFDKFHIYSKAMSSSESMQAAFDKAATIAQTNLVQRIKQNTLKRIRQSLASLELADKDQIVSRYVQAAISKNNVIFQNYQIHKRDLYQFKEGYRVFVCLKISRQELKKATAEGLLNELKSESDDKIREQIQKTANQMQAS